MTEQNEMTELQAADYGEFMSRIHEKVEAVVEANGGILKCPIIFNSSLSKRERANGIKGRICVFVRGTLERPEWRKAARRPIREAVLEAIPSDYNLQLSEVA